MSIEGESRGQEGRGQEGAAPAPADAPRPLPPPGPAAPETAPARRRTRREALEAWLQGVLHAGLAASNRLRLPGPSVLPVAGALVGIYAGLAAGIFTSLIRLVRGFADGPRTAAILAHLPETFAQLERAFEKADWHPELAVVGIPLALAALGLSRVILPGGPRDQVKRRLRVLALLVLGALSLYYPLLGLATLDDVIGAREGADAMLADLPFWLLLLAPTVGGALVGRMLRDRPHIHGHGVPEVVAAVQREKGDLSARGGLMKLIASAVTIGSGGSAGREGPIVYGGAAFGASVGRTLGFSRQELSILMASGAGAGIAASFNAPIAGAMFALEIILRDFKLKVFSPIILASVSATLVARTVMGQSMMVRRFGYQMVSGWEAFGYAGLGLVCGLVAFAFVRLLHGVEGFFAGHGPSRLSAFVAKRSLPERAALGGFCVGVMALINPIVWGTGHEFVNLASAGNLSITFLLIACALKVLGTSVTIGSGGSGGTFFPAVVMGSMAGGAFGMVLHALFPHGTAPSGAYAMVGMGGVVAGFTRGPLTGMLMVYELSGNYAIILPLMVTCTLSSALCHALTERRKATAVSDQELLQRAEAGVLVVPASPVPAATRVSELMELLLSAEGGALPVLDGRGQPVAVVQLHHLREVWRDEALARMLNAADVAFPVHPLSADESLSHAVSLMDQDDVDALPVVDGRGALLGLVTRSGIRRYLRHTRARVQAETHGAVAATEV